MDNRSNKLREFGKFRLDVARQVLWCDDNPVKLPLKCIEVLIALTGPGNQVVTKTELLDSIWQDSFVEESNLSRHIYLLRKTFDELGEPDLIETIPRRGYRFTGEMHEVLDTRGDITIEEHSVVRTVIELRPDTPVAIEDTFGTSVPLLPAGMRTGSRNRRGWLTGVALLLFGLAGIAAWKYQTWTDGSNFLEIRSIAVLPFKTIDPQADDQHRGVGLADLLITRLTNVSELTVRPTSAVLRFGDEESVVVGHKLGVDAVLEGTIYRADEMLRVTTRLVRVSDGTAIWSGEVEKPLADELRMQDEIALQVINALSLNLSGNERAALTKRFTESAEAYQLYLRGRYEWNKRSVDGMLEAERLFREAIKRDPNFALAYVGQADQLATRASSEHAYRQLEKALAIDPDLAEAHASLGFMQTFHRWDWERAEKSFKRSIELKPNYATSHHWYATLLAILGRYPEAKGEMRRALEIDPLSHNFLADMGQIYYFERDYEKAKEYCLRALEIYPEFHFAHLYLKFIYLKLGDYENSLASETKIYTPDRVLATAAEKAEHRESADHRLALLRKGGIELVFNTMLRDLDVQMRKDYLSQAMVHSFLGNKDEALTALERTLEDPDEFFFVFVKADPIFDPLRQEPRYKAVLQKMRLE
jgi:DNA-binding winged helix-turn-helix (wHTH) protein/TolB-like protein